MTDGHGERIGHEQYGAMAMLFLAIAVIGMIGISAFPGSSVMWITFFFGSVVCVLAVLAALFSMPPEGLAEHASHEDQERGQMGPTPILPVFLAVTTVVAIVVFGWVETEFDAVLAYGAGALVYLIAFTGKMLAPVLVQKVRVNG